MAQNEGHLIAGPTYAQQVTSDRDPDYQFQPGSEIITALGRITFGSAHLESYVGTVLGRLLGDHFVAERLAADSTFGWLVSHTRAIAEIKTSDDDFKQIDTWLTRAEKAYSARNRVVHSHWVIVVTGLNPNTTTRWNLHRTTTRGKGYSSRMIDSTAGDLHAIAHELEDTALDGLRIIQLLPEAPIPDDMNAE